MYPPVAKQPEFNSGLSKADILWKEPDDRLVLGFSMRAIARLFGLGCVWPALGNLTRRKLRGLVEPYGESVKQVLPQLPQDAAVVRCWH